MDSVVSGDNITIDATDPANPIANLDVDLTAIGSINFTPKAAPAHSEVLIYYDNTTKTFN